MFIALVVGFLILAIVALIRDGRMTSVVPSWMCELFGMVYFNCCILGHGFVCAAHAVDLARKAFIARSEDFDSEED